MSVLETKRPIGRKQERGGGRGRKVRKLRLGAYPRVSRVGGREDERLRSPAFQLELMRRLELEGEIELVEYPAELDVSGGKPRREILDQIIGAIEAGELDGIAVAKLDRLARLRPVDRVELLARIEDAGGVIRSASEQLDERTPEGRFARDVFLGVARMQLEKYAEGFEMSKRNAIAEGISIARVRPFGLEHDERHRLRVVECEAAIVLELFERRAGGASYGELAEFFAAETGREVPRSTIRYMLENRVYMGELRYRLGEDELVNTEAVDAIVPAELFETVQAVNRSRSSGRGVAVRRAKALLAGLARCGNCGRRLVRTRTGSRRKGEAERPYSYKCPNDARLCNARAHISAEKLDDYVIERVLEWAGPEADELVEVELPSSSEGERLIAERRLRQAETARAEYEADAELELEVGAEAYRAGRRARVELVERRRQELQRLGEASELEVARSTIRAALTEDELNVEERRRLLSVVLEAVIVRRTPYRGAPASERVEVVFRA